MSHTYKVVGWTPYKKWFDAFLVLGVGGYLAIFISISAASGADISGSTSPVLHPVQILIRAFGTAAFGLLSLILMIGPLARLSPAFLPLLYNRRHLGVTTFFLSLFHFALALMWYHGFSATNPFISLLVSNPNYDQLGGFPFESLGLIAFFVLFVMAATSHDFWNANLGPNIWKTLHMAVYPAYALLLGHILLGVIQQEKALIYPFIAGSSAALIVTLHLITAHKETARDGTDSAEEDNWLRIDGLELLEDGKALIIAPETGDRIAIFRRGDELGAIANACRHQNGPLGEGKIIDCLVTCPWHGFQYQLEDGRSPPPFNEQVATYTLQWRDGALWLDLRSLPPGTARPLTPFTPVWPEKEVANA